MTPDNKALHQTRRVGAAASRPVVETRLAGEGRWFDGPLWQDVNGRGGLRSHSGAKMQNYSFVVERDADTGLYVGHIPGWPGAHSQGETLDELQGNIQEVVAMLLADGAPRFESEFVGVQTIKVA